MVVRADLPAGTGCVLLARHRSYKQPLEGTRVSITMPCASSIESAFDTRVLHIDAVGAWLVGFASNIEAVAPNDAGRISTLRILGQRLALIERRARQHSLAAAKELSNSASFHALDARNRLYDCSCCTPTTRAG